jgi:hypothetical protein
LQQIATTVQIRPLRGRLNHSESQSFRFSAQIFSRSAFLEGGEGVRFWSVAEPTLGSPEEKANQVEIKKKVAME